MNQFLNLLGLNNLNYNEILWVIVGTSGQLVFFSRWIIQWASTEKKNQALFQLLSGGVV